MSEFQDSNVVFVYTREDAIRDGVLIEVDTYKGEQICITDNAFKIAGLEDETLRNHVIKAAIEALRSEQNQVLRQVNSEPKNG